MALTIGQNCWLGYYSTAAEAYVKVPKVRDHNRDLSVGEIDATSRDDASWENVIAGTRSGSASFDMIRDTTNAVWRTLFNAFVAGTTLYFQFLDAADGTGIQVACAITAFNDGEPLKELATTTVNLRFAAAPVPVIDGVAGTFPMATS